jgi:hypothetical protein
MKYEVIKTYKPATFRRLTGVKPKTFEVTVDVLCEVFAAKHKRGAGCPS